MEALTTTAKFGATAQGVIKRIDELIRRRKLDANRKTVVVMATNQGTLDLVANFACSCRAGPPEVQRALASTLVFTGDSETSKQVELFGLASFHDSALGDLPEGAAKAYGDYAFVRMMWLKITSVYSVVATGRHALFQDADVVWLRDPIEYFFTEADDQVDCFFMDDGARSARYTPLYTNSGFYFIRNNMRTQFFMHRMLMAYDTVLAVRSHQHALICVEIIAVALNLRVDLDAIDATPARRRGGAPDSHWLICAQGRKPSTAASRSDCSSWPTSASAASARLWRPTPNSLPSF